MPCGLFGKLAAKRDFISVNTPKEFLLLWEAWLQGGVQASKIALEGEWLPAYLHAPLWRFSLGEAICGVAVRGVFMSSMDGVGRHFPLSVFTCAPPGQRFARPGAGDDTAWFEAAEDFLLSTIDDGADYDAVLARLAALPDGEAQDLEQSSPVATRFGAAILPGAEPLDLAACMAALDAVREREDAALRSWFWTIGGVDYPPTVATASRLPDPNIMSTLLAGAALPAPASA